MAINLWALSQPVNYNPLPQSWGNGLVIGIGRYVLTFTARSSQQAEFNVSTQDPSVVNTGGKTTSEFQTYSFEINNTKEQLLRFREYPTTTGGIEVTDIQLVEKPLGALTINGISGDVSDWEQGNFHAVFGQIESTPSRIKLKQTFNVIPDKSYYIDIPDNYNVALWVYDHNKNHVYAGWHSTGVFKTPINAHYLGVSLRKSDNTTITPSDILTAKPMLYLGTLQGVPYEPKRGERMVEPVVSGKNLFNKIDIEGGYARLLNDHTLLVSGATSAGADSSGQVKLNVEKDKEINVSAYITNINDFDITVGVSVAGANKPLMLIRKGETQRMDSFWNPTLTGTTTFRMWSLGGHDFTVTKLQLEQGTTATPYEPFEVQLNQHDKRNLPAKQGLLLDGTGYVQLPSHTMDSIEIECLIDGKTNTNSLIFDARYGGGVSAFVRVNGINPEGFGVYVDGALHVSSLPLDQKINLRLTKSTFAESVKVFSSGVKGILYRVTTYLNGVVQQDYDFTKPIDNGVVYIGEQPQNLLPSFDSGLWNLHSNARVLGRDVLELRASGTAQWSNVLIPVSPNTNYQLTCEKNGRFAVRGGETLDWISPFVFANILTFNSGNNQTLDIRLDNGTSTGAFTFQTPRLIKIPNAQASVIGGATPQVKRAKRQLFAKR